MQHRDYIIVGFGIAGVAIARTLLERGKSFVIFDSQDPGATTVAGGTINPVVLKRFKAVWKASEFFETAQEFYRSLQDDVGVSFLKEIPVHRILQSPEEQNDWLVASDSAQCRDFLNSKIRSNSNSSVHAPFGLGEVLQTLHLDTPKLLSGFKKYLQDQDCWIRERFEYTSLQRTSEGVQYKSWSAKKIIFCDGIGALENPFFSLKHLIPKKGEYITIKVPELKVTSVLKGPFFIIPLGNDRYRVGATFIHKDLSPTPTEKSLQQLERALKKMLHCDFEVVDRSVGMRPTVSDRKPLLGWFEDPKISFMNGLGTRGLFMAPLLATWLLDALEAGDPLPQAIDLKRFL